MGFRLPERDKRTTILGRTGSGKTQCAMWILAHADWHLRPCVVIDSKGEKLLKKQGIRECVRRMKMTDAVPSAPGIYVYSPVPHRDDDVLEDLLFSIWERGNIILYIDEGYMVCNNKIKSMDAIYTQGRSKKIQVIALFQRPVWMNRFAISECDYYFAFHIADARDRKTVSEYVPGYDRDIDLIKKYHCIWYSVSDHEKNLLTPVPDANKIAEIFDIKRREYFSHRWI